MMQVEKMVYNVNEIQVMLGLGRNKTYDLVNSNEFPVRRVDNRILIPKEPFIKWLYGNHIEEQESA